MLTTVGFRTAGICAALALAVVGLSAQNAVPVEDRNSFEKPEPFVPGAPATLDYELPDVYHAFRRGHRIMVQVQSSWFPLVDRNPQRFMEIPKAVSADFQNATQRVYRSAAQPSSITVLVEASKP